MEEEIPCTLITDNMSGHFMYHDMIFSGPMAGATRIFPAVAMADAFLATAAFAETKELPKFTDHPLYKLFPEFVEQLNSIG